MNQQHQIEFPRLLKEPLDVDAAVDRIDLTELELDRVINPRGEQIAFEDRPYLLCNPSQLIQLLLREPKRPKRWRWLGPARNS